MTDQNELQTQLLELNNVSHPAWDEPIICRVEVDLPAWVAQLAGGSDWEVTSEDEDETCISFAMREKNAAKVAKVTPKIAEVTLYHNGYAVVDVEGKALFDGSLTSGTATARILAIITPKAASPSR